MGKNGQGHYVHAIRKALSSERLDAYGLGRTDDQKLANYLWNLALCESLYPALNGLEIAFRNAVFNAGARNFSGVATRDVPCWLDANPSLFDTGQEQSVIAAKLRPRDRGRALVPGRLVAELTFGFWTSLFEVQYEREQGLVAAPVWRTAARLLLAALAQAPLAAAEPHAVPPEPRFSPRAHLALGKPG